MSQTGHSDFHDASRAASDFPADALRRAWLLGNGPDLDAFVAGWPDLAPRDLAELIQIDLEARWGRADRARLEDYFARFAAVAADAESAVDVVYAEYLAREQAGEQPQLAEYQARFPALARVLADQVRLHHAFDELDEESSQTTEDPEPSLADALPSADDGYEIVEQIGSGGMGVVYKARQTALDRLVAIKMVRAIDNNNRELLTRFRVEAQLVATLHHPHIVQVYDYGQHGGLPYIAMELVEGGTLADRLNGTPWLPRPAAELMVKLADAMHYAHERHVVHRDLKPANILIDSRAADLVVKITDFGLARLVADEPSHNTRSYTFLGTPSYMAPEQANGRAREIGPAADIYSLGAMLCELLTGRPPFRGETPAETLRLLLMTEPRSVGHLSPRIPRDLATICDTCLQGQPNRRYASAAALGDDLKRYLEGRPIQARPVRNVERVWRWGRRNPLLAGALGSVALLLVGIAIVSTWYSTRLSRELTRTRQVEVAERTAHEDAQHRLWDSYLSEAAARNASRQAGQRFAALALVDKANALLDVMGRDAKRELRLRNAVLSSAVLSDIHEVRSFAAEGLTAYGCAMSLSANCAVVTTFDGAVIAYRLSDGARLWRFESQQPQSRPMLSRDGRWLATTNEQVAKVWRITDGRPQLAWDVADVQLFTFSPDGAHAVYGTRDEGMRLVRADNGEVLRPVGRGRARSKCAFDTIGGRIAVCAEESVQVIATATGQIETEFPLGDVPDPPLAWHPGGRYLAEWSSSEGIALWDVESRKKIASLPHRGMPAHLGFNEDGSILASQGLWNQRLLAWDVGSGQRFLEVPDFASHACDAGPDGRIMLVTLKADEVVLSEIVAGACRTLAQTLYEPLGYWDAVSISPDGRLAACASGVGLELWDLQTARRLFARSIGPCSAKFDRQGRLIVACNSRIYRLSRHVESTAGRTIVCFDGAEQLADRVAAMTLSSNTSGETLLIGGSPAWTVLHQGDLSEKVTLKPGGDPRKGAVSDDNRFAAIATWERGGAEVWDATTGAKLADLPVGRHGVVRFSPDSKLLAATPDGVSLWDTETWQCLQRLEARGTTPTGLGISFSPDSRVLAVGQTNGVLALFDTRTGNECARLSHRDQSMASNLTFSPDQRWLLTASVDERSPAQIWDLAALRRELTARRLDWSADALVVGPTESIFEQRLEVVFNDRGVFDAGSPAEPP